MIAPLVGWLVGSYVGKRVGRAYGEREADRLAWLIAEQMGAPLWRTFTCHPDGTVDA